MLTVANFSGARVSLLALASIRTGVVLAKGVPGAVCGSLGAFIDIATVYSASGVPGFAATLERSVVVMARGVRVTIIGFQFTFVYICS